ncbi:MAG TPA: nuclear transport factor 2 family protein [Acidocella sp.]|jgi:hypothetical protein|nr:nuclear transport factor 2 family protein [Acidocella sp.]
MTQDDALAHAAIRDTLARYNMAGDRLRVEDFCATFTEDGVLETGTYTLTGRAGIRAWMSGFRPAGSLSAKPARVPRFVRHHLATCQIDLTGPDTAPDSAQVRTYWMVLTDIGPDHAGLYVDRFRREDGRWLIAHRKARTEWFAPESYFAPVS